MSSLLPDKPRIAIVGSGALGCYYGARLAKAGNEYVMSTPDEFVPFLRAEIAKWTKLVRESNIRIE